MNRPAPTAFERPAQLAVISLSLAASFALYLLRLAQEANEDGPLAGLALGYTLALAPPLVAALLLERGRDLYAYAAALLYAALLTPLALYSGAAADGLPRPEPDAIFAPYCASLFFATFLLIPFLQALRRGQARHYPMLYQYAWDNGLTLGAAVFFTGAGWCILLLWAALFNLIGIDFFEELFGERSFIYLANGLFVGLGITLSRTQPGAIRALLRVCLALGRALLPLIAFVAVVFAIGLLFTGLEKLWDTRRAASLLLTLVFGVVALANSVFQDGSEERPYAALARRLAEAALLLLPVYAALAAWALGLRVQQYGWTIERLWGALLAFYALCYAGLYAVAVLRRGGGVWLGRIGPANIALAGIIVLSLLLTQSPLINFRAIAVDSHVARFADGRLPIQDLDVDYLRWRSGTEGVAALTALEQDPRVQADATLLAKVKEALTAKERYFRADSDQVKLDERSFEVVPAGTTLPPLLLASLQTYASRENEAWSLGRCREAEPCTLIAISLDDDPALEWVAIPRNGDWPVFAETPSGFVVRATTGSNTAYAHIEDRREPLKAEEVRAVAPQWKHLELRGRVYVLRPVQGVE